MYISIDIGGTNIRIAGSNSLEKPKFEFIQRVKAIDNYKKDLENIYRIITSSRKPIVGISIGIPGTLNKSRTKADFPNLSDWRDKEVKKDFENAFCCPVFLENDANLAGLGEGFYGNGKNKDFVFIIWGTGLGGVHIKRMGAKISLKNFNGHQFILEKNGRAGSCGHKGDLECYVGGSSIEKYYKKKADKLSEKEWEEVISYFSKGLKLILKKYPANLLIFGGGIALGQPDKVKRIEKELQKENPKLRILISKLGDNAGLYGGLALLKRNRKTDAKIYPAHNL